MKVFVVNCGSSSIKYQLFELPGSAGSGPQTREGQCVLARGILERIGSDQARLRHEGAGARVESRVIAPGHAEALGIILKALVSGEGAVIADIAGIGGVGHRVVHGGEDVTASARIDDALLEVIRRNAELAPLHNPPNLAGIEGAMRAMPDIPHVAVFDTAFLATLPPRAHRYAVPEAWYRRHGVRRYGFHGTSHRYVTLRTAELLHKRPEDVNLITCHLGNGCSMTAVEGGRAVDHSMGMTPLEGLVMGTRCGDLDPAVVIYMASHGMSIEQIDAALNKESGLLAVSGLSNDMRDLLAGAKQGDDRCALAVEMFVYRVVKYVGAYHAILPGVDAVVLTGGIGENSVPVRGGICRGLARLGAALDEPRNAAAVGGRHGPITSDGSPLAVWVVPTDEELMIARDTADIVAERDA